MDDTDSQDFGTPRPGEDAAPPPTPPEQEPVPATSDGLSELLVECEALSG